MGAHASFKIGKFDFLITKNSYTPLIDCIFNKTDFYIEEETIDGEVYKKYVFKTNVESCKTCLDLMGYTLKKAKHDFEENFFDAIDYYNPKVMEDNEERIRKYLTRNFSFKRWVKHVVFYAKWMIENDQYDEKYENRLNAFKSKSVCEKCVLNSLTDWNSDSYFGMNYDYYDCINTVRIILENLEADLEVSYDVTDLIESGYISLQEFEEIDNHPVKKMIVLVEGTTDKNILEFALNKIYPHYSKFFYIMDFDNPKRPGSASEITRIIKAFMCSHIDSNFIALYDNDVAGRKEVLSFQNIKIPENIRIQTYPSIKFANSYPTMGTNGKIVKDNINGRACSIELYLPDSILWDDDTDFPNYIVWKSLDDKLKDYQGEINNKGIIFKKFLAYKKQIEENEISFNETEWSKMKQLLDSFIFAFVC